MDTDITGLVFEELGKTYFALTQQNKIIEVLQQQLAEARTDADDHEPEKEPDATAHSPEEGGTV